VLSGEVTSEKGIGGEDLLDLNARKFVWLIIREEYDGYVKVRVAEGIVG
jgi:hypothetical protein